MLLKWRGGGTLRFTVPLSLARREVVIVGHRNLGGNGLLSLQPGRLWDYARDTQRAQREFLSGGGGGDLSLRAQLFLGIPPVIPTSLTNCPLVHCIGATVRYIVGICTKLRSIKRVKTHRQICHFCKDT